MKFQAELPEPGNERRGPGWWMDTDGIWRPPEQWPEDYPPLAGWVLGPDGTWNSPDTVRSVSTALELAVIAGQGGNSSPQSEPFEGSRSSADHSDDRRMWVISGSIAAVMLMLAGALAVVTQAGASDDGRAPTTPASTAGVIFAAETESDIRALRQSMALEAPALARGALDALETIAPDEMPSYDPAEWLPDDDRCLSTSELVLAGRSTFTVGYLDDAGCELATGEWFDRYQGTRLRRAIDTSVVPHVPVIEVFVSGGWKWSPETRLRFLTDVADLANLQVISADSGHNPRSAPPDQWKPAQERTWCAYAVDWITVKARWSLSVLPTERTALVEMLDSCDAPTSDGADPATIALDPLADPEIVEDPA